MRSVRRRVRAWVTTWLVCQFVAVSAFAPRECCEAHRPAVSAPTTHGSGDHATAQAGHHGGHHAAHGNVQSAPTASPGGHAHHQQADATVTPARTAGGGATPDERACIMRGACRGPITAVVTLFLTPADPLGAYTLAANQTPALHAGPAADPTLDLSPSVVTPPPRA